MPFIKIRECNNDIQSGGGGVSGASAVLHVPLHPLVSLPLARTSITALILRCGGGRGSVIKYLHNRKCVGC